MPNTSSRSTASSQAWPRRGSKADRWDLVALNAIMELPYYYAPWLDKKQGKKPEAHAPGNCSAFIATGSFTRDGRIVMGHNNWTGYVIGTRWNIIFDLAPEKGQRLLMDGLPGVITSDDDFAVNDAGLLVTETTITQFEGWDPDGKPEFVRSRKAMQYGRSIDDFARIMLEGNNGGYANDWLVGDTKTGEVAQLELGLKEHTLKRTKDGCFVGSNFPEGEALIKLETKFDPNNPKSSPNARRKRWGQLIAETQGEDRHRGRQGDGDRRLRRLRGQDRRQRADPDRDGRDVPSRCSRVGLGAVLPRRYRPVEGDRRRRWPAGWNSGPPSATTTPPTSSPTISSRPTPNTAGCGGC